MQYGAVILAAGKGERFKSEKQFYNFHGKPIWRYAYDLILQILPRDAVVVVGEDVPGGKTRTESVVRGLQAMLPNTDRVIILEAARPLVTLEQIKTLLSDINPSVTFVMPLVNTVIKRDGTYLNRNELYELLTPQAFDYKLLKEAYEKGQFKDMTDETRVMYEYHGISPTFIEAGQNLFKVTYPRDIAILESIYQMQKEGI